MNEIRPTEERHFLVIDPTLSYQQRAGIELFGLTLFALLNAYFAAQQPGTITSLWYVNGFAITLMLFSSKYQRIILLAGLTVGLSAGYWCVGVRGGELLILLLANLTEVTIALSLLLFCQCAVNFHLNIINAMKLGVGGIFLPALAGGVIAATGLISLCPLSWLTLFSSWFVNSIISSASFMPLTLYFFQPQKIRAQIHHYSLLPLLAVLLLYTMLILKFFAFPYVYLVLGLALIAIHSGVLGATIAGLLVSFCVAFSIRMSLIVWPEITEHVGIYQRYIPLLTTLIPPLLLAIYVDTVKIREQQLLAREAMFREAMEASAIGMALVSIDGQMIKVNQALSQMLNYSESELISKEWSQLYYPADLPADLRLRDALLSHKQNSYRIETRYLQKNGTPIWVLLVVSIVRDDRQLPHYFLLQIEDINTQRQSEERERELFSRYTLALEAGQIGVWEWNLATTAVSWDDRMYELLGLVKSTPPSLELWQHSLHPDDRAKLAQEVQHSLAESNVVNSEFRVIYPDSSVHYLRTHAIVERDRNGDAVRMVGTNWDITELRVLMNELSREREFLRTTLWSIGEAVVMTDQHLRVIFMNQTAEHLLRCSSLQVTNQPVEQVMKLVDANLQPLPHPLQLAFEQRKVCFLSDETYLSVHGRMIAIQDSAAPIIGDNDALLGGVMVFSDVTQERSLQKELSYQASHDQLTGLINRSAFEMILQDVIKESVMTAGQSALVFLDLDYFKQVNDTAGHAAGDELLKQIAQLMLDCTRSSDIVGRLGGDEFGLIFRHCSLDYANAMMNELIYRIAQLAFQWNEQLFHVGASAGLVVINEHFTSSSSLLANADHACYAAKRAGRGQVKTVSPLFDAHSAD